MRKHKRDTTPAPAFREGMRVVYTQASAAFAGRTGELSRQMDRAGTLWAVRVDGEPLLIASPADHFQVLADAPSLDYDGHPV